MLTFSLISYLNDIATYKYVYRIFLTIRCTQKTFLWKNLISAAYTQLRLMYENNKEVA